jgi:hypothetical protein
MVGKVSAVVLGGLLLAAAAAAPDALARRGAGPCGGRAGNEHCRQQGDCRGDRDRDRQRLRDGSCPQDPSTCPNPDCPKTGAGRQDGTGKGAGKQ